MMELTDDRVRSGRVGMKKLSVDIKELNERDDKDEGCGYSHGWGSR